MSKVICDICGTTYPETADRCPICGAPRSENTQSAAAGAAAAAAEAPAKVKGGRFSTSNVKKRNSDAQSAAKGGKQGSGDGPDKVNRALLIVLLALLLAIVCVMVFIVVRFFPGNGGSSTESTPPAISTDSTATTGSEETTQPTESEAPAQIPCVSLRLQQTLYMLTTDSPTASISVTASPENTTDTVVFVSDDPSVVSVSEDGTLTAVGSGNATITITCGQTTVQCVVVVDVAEPTTATEDTQPTEETEESTEATEPSTEPPVAAFTLDTYDVTMRYPEESFTFHPSVSVENITWSSDDPSIATVENGRVTAVGTGITIVRAQYGGQERECIIRCLWLELDSDSVTLTVGETKKIDSNSLIYSSSVTWTSDNVNVATVENGVVTAVGEGTAVICGEYRDVIVKCTVTVKAAETQPSESTESTEATQATDEPTQATEESTETGSTNPTE